MAMLDPSAVAGPSFGPLLAKAGGVLLASGVMRILYRFFKVRMLFRRLKAQGIVS
jgi:hypothetical protein